MKSKKSALGVTLLLLIVPLGGILLLFVLSSGFTLSAGNKSTFCVNCHVMKPFVRSWADSPHGGNNARGIVVECTDCHLPHDSLVRFVFAKVKGGISLLIRNLSIDGTTFDWYSNAKQHRQRFTHDTSCSNCHRRLQQFCNSGRAVEPPSPLVAGRTTCLDCHPSVGHRNVMSVAEKFFQQHAGGSGQAGPGRLVLEGER